MTSEFFSDVLMRCGASLLANLASSSDWTQRRRLIPIVDADLIPGILSLFARGSLFGGNNCLNCFFGRGILPVGLSSPFPLGSGL